MISRLFSLVVPSQTGNSRSRTALALLHRLSSTQPRAVSASSRAYACAHFRRFSIFAFTPSPTCRNPHNHNAISVKTLLAVLHRRLHFGIDGSGLCFQCTVSPPAGAATRAELVRSHSATGERRGEGSPPQAFTHISLWFNNLRNKGEEVKEKNRNCLTGAYAYARERSHFRVSHPCGAVTNESKRGSAEKLGSFQRKVACFGRAAEEFFSRLSEGASVACEVFTAQCF